MDTADEFCTGANQAVVADRWSPTFTFANGYLMENTCVAADFCVMGYNNAIEAVGEVRNALKVGAVVYMGAK